MSQTPDPTVLSRSSGLTRHDSTARRKALLSGAALAFVVGTSAAAQSGPIKLIVAFPPGGGADALARLVGEELRKELNTPIIIDSRPGAGGIIGAQALKAAPPDGTTYMVTVDHQVVIAPHTMKNPGYDALNDFSPVAQITNFNICLGVNPKVIPAKTLPEYFAEIKKNPTLSSYAIPAPGSAPQFIGGVLAQSSGTSMTPVAYRGAGPAIVDLLGGHVPAAIVPCLDFKEHHASGALRVLAVAGNVPVSWAPGAPTLNSHGINMDTNFSIGIMGPAKLSPDSIQKMQAALENVISNPELSERIKTLGFEPKYLPASTYGDVVKKANNYWGQQIRATGYQAE